MQSATVRPPRSMSLSLLGSHACTTACRRSALPIVSGRQPGLRPLHASPIFQRPRRRDFFSSNAVLCQKKDDSNDQHHASNSNNSHHNQSAHPPQSNSKRSVLDKEAAPAVPLAKRKTARLSGAQASLRRAALEAQRSRDGKQARPSVAAAATINTGSSNGINGNNTAITTAASGIGGAAGAGAAVGAGTASGAPKLVTAYAVAETFDVNKVIDILRSNGYEPDPLHTGLYPQVVHVQVPIPSLYRSSGLSAALLDPSDVGDVFIFPSGTVVTWALPPGFTSYLATRTLLPAATNPHTELIETEDLEYIEDPTRETSSVRGDTFILGTKPPSHFAAAASSSSSLSASSQPQQQQHQHQQQQQRQDHQQNLQSQTQQDQQQQVDLTPSAVDTVLTKIAFSSGFARSTKLAVLETMLNTYLASTASIPSILAKGSRLPFRFSRSFILRKTGQLLQLRAQLNLYSELTDSLPDLFWDSRHELNLENYYDQVGRALDVGIRIKVLNEKMDYAAEIASVLRERLSEKHGTFLEWTIIILIAIEVGFEILRLRKEGFWQDHNPATDDINDSKKNSNNNNTAKKISV